MELSRVPGWPALAGAGEVRGWFGISALIAAAMLAGVGVAAVTLAGQPYVGSSSALVTGDTSLRAMLEPAGRNLLVLGIHFCAALIGAIVGRPTHQLPPQLARLQRFNPPVPGWLGRASIVYALVVTAFSVVLQTTALGLVAADIAASLAIQPWQLLVMVLPHAIPELTAIFLPLGLLLVQVRRDRLAPLGSWCWQAAAIAVPLLLAAAAVEAWVSPWLLSTVL